MSDALDKQSGWTGSRHDGLANTLVVELEVRYLKRGQRQLALMRSQQEEVAVKTWRELGLLARGPLPIRDCLVSERDVVKPRPRFVLHRKYTTP
jgi:hypothetical protein